MGMDRVSDDWRNCCGSVEISKEDINKPKKPLLPRLLKRRNDLDREIIRRVRERCKELNRG